jgi:tetratricopeptide (TPR) repeat protein
MKDSSHSETETIASWRRGLPWALALVTFLLFAFSLRSDFVYDGRTEILKEGFITSPSNLPAVLSLKVLRSDLILGQRPGQLLYLMLIAAVSGKNPLLYHLASNLLHAANVALLFVVLRRLAAAEMLDVRAQGWKVDLAAATAALIFAVHPLVVELACGAVVVLGALAAVMCKESGIAVPILVALYGLLYRRGEARLPWLALVSAAGAVVALFLAARFLLALPQPSGLTCLGGSLYHALCIQPRVWVFMIGKLVWPTGLSADYTLQSFDGLSSSVAVIALGVVVALQVQLARASRLGAMGLAVYWLGLATVSNLVPLYRFLGDRFYYLPLAGVAMQLMALLLLCLGRNREFFALLAVLGVALIPLAALNVVRQFVFTNELTLWSDAVRVSPTSLIVHINLGNALFELKRFDEAMVHFREAVAIDPRNAEAQFDLGNALLRQGQVDASIPYLQNAVDLRPSFLSAHLSLGTALSDKNRYDEAMTQFEQGLELDPNNVLIMINLGGLYAYQGHRAEAISLLEKAARVDPGNALAHCDLGYIYRQNGQLDQAIAEFQTALQLQPEFKVAKMELERTKQLLGQRGGN